ncbi:MAG: hypothetical protein ACWGO1_02720, partial [Anaerolineales bacterium]
MRKYNAPAFKRIVIPILPSCDCEHAMNAAMSIAGQGEVVLIGLVQVEAGEPLSAAAGQARQVRQIMRQYSKQYRVRSISNVRVTNHVVEELTNFVEEQEQPDLLLLEWPCHFKALNISMNDMMHWANCDIAVVRGPVPLKPENLLVPIRGGPYAELSLRIALAIHRSARSSVTSLHILPASASLETEVPFDG